MLYKNLLTLQCKVSAIEYRFVFVNFLHMVHIKVILGSTREGRFSEVLVPWITASLSAHSDVSAEVVDLRDYSMPFYEESGSPAAVKDGQYPNEIVRAFAEKVLK